MGLPVLLPLGQSDVQRLGHDDPAVHLGDGLGGLLGGGEADEAEALGASLLAHHLGRGDGAVGSELLPQPLVIDGVVQVLDVEIDPLVSVESLQLQLLELLLELGLSFSLLLGSTDVESLSANVGAVQLLHGLLGRLGVLEGDESEALGLATVVGGNGLGLLRVKVTLVISDHFVRGDLPVLGEHLLQLLISQVVAEVLDVDVGELLGLLSKLLLALLARDKPPDEHLLLVQQHAVDLLDSVHCGLLGLEVDKSVALAGAVSILGHLTGENVSEGGESIVHGLVVDTLVQVLDEHVADSRSSQGGVTLTPHDPDRATLEDIKVHGVQGTLGISWLLEVDVGVAKRPPGDHVPAHPDGEDGARGGELLEEHGLGDLGCQVSHVETRHGVIGPGLGRSGLKSHLSLG